MSGINWNLLQPLDVAGSAMRGFQQGRALRQQLDTDNALAAFARAPSDPASVNALMRVNPEMGLKLGEFQRDAATREAYGQLFDPAAASPRGISASAPATQPADPAAPPPPLAMNPDGSPPADVAAMGGPTAVEAPRFMVDPSKLPPRTDGLTLNKDALRTLYRLDPQAALAVQKSVFAANEAQFKQMRQNGATLAQAAWHLKRIPVENRAAELEAMASQLMQMGLSPEQLAQADLTDEGLERYLVTGRTISSILDDDRADRRLDATIENIEVDNERADRNTDSLITDRTERRGLIRRNQDLTDARGRLSIATASTDRRRGQDLRDTTTRRGQDLNDKRVRETGGRRGRGNAPQVVNVKSPDEARALPAGTMFRTPDGRVKVR